MSLFVSIYAAILFFILTPAILVRLPPGGSKMTVAAVHAIVFALIFHFTHKVVWRLGARFEGFDIASSTTPAASTTPTRLPYQTPSPTAPIM
jgi:hypothetical protein